VNIYVRLRVADSRAPPSHIPMQAVHAVPSRAPIALPCSAVRIRALARIPIRLSAEAKAERDAKAADSIHFRKVTMHSKICIMLSISFM
jgi:hypothetical protein